ncbi:MAG: hypothetical protein JNL72_11090 [Flavipsychrobacter sp.]|nr:hypothetical protein [Flavipsychrobacter sp.]
MFRIIALVIACCIPVVVFSADTCSRVTGMHVTGVTSYGAQVQWNGEATKGYLCVVTKSVVPPPRIGKFIKEPYFDATGLAAAATYYAHVRAVCSSASSDWATVRFNTPAPADKMFELTETTFAVSAYPLLAEETVTIKVKGSSEPQASVFLRDVWGRTLETFTMFGDRIHVEVGKLPAGIYYACYYDALGRVQWMRFTR